MHLDWPRKRSIAGHSFTGLQCSRVNYKVPCICVLQKECQCILKPYFVHRQRSLLQIPQAGKKHSEQSWVEPQAAGAASVFWLSSNCSGDLELHDCKGAAAEPGAGLHNAAPPGSLCILTGKILEVSAFLKSEDEMHCLLCWADLSSHWRTHWTAKNKFTWSKFLFLCLWKSQSAWLQERQEFADLLENVELVIGYFNHQVDSEKGDPRAEWSVSQVLQVIRSKLLQDLMPPFSIAACHNQTCLLLATLPLTGILPKWQNKSRFWCSSSDCREPWRVAWAK